MIKQTKKVAIITVTIAILFSIIPVQAKSANSPNVIYFDNFYKTEKGKGYIGKKDIGIKDLHYGWKLGEFKVTGFTSYTKDEKGNYIFLKTVGSKINLEFILNQNINKLNNNSKLKISEDNGTYDKEFKTDIQNFKKGTLIIRKTDANNKLSEPEIYSDYLKGVKKGANTKIETLDEGDYEIALDYEIEEEKVGFNKRENYRFRINFSVRNGNCMVFLRDSKTQSELMSNDITKNGFYIDFANSKYLNVIVKKEVLHEGAMGLTEDTRYNRPAKHMENFTEEGIYTITVKNKYTKANSTKKVYIGDNKVLKAHIRTGYTINDINNMIKLGAQVDDNGRITNIPKEYQSENDNSNYEYASKKTEKNILDFWPTIIPIVIIAIYFIKNKKTEKTIKEETTKRVKERTKRIKKTGIKKLEEDDDEYEEGL